MNFGAFFCLLLAHFIADYPLQFPKVLQMRNSVKKSERLAGNGIHAAIHFVVSIMLVSYYWSHGMLLIVLALSVAHWLIDYAKSMLCIKKPYLKNSVGVFFLDQALHMASIYLALYLTFPYPAVSTGMKMQFEGIVSFIKSSAAQVTDYDKIMLSLILLLAGLWGTGIFIRILFRGMNDKRALKDAGLKRELVQQSPDAGADAGGFIIGILERTFIILSIILNMPLVIGFILTTKSVARLKKFYNDRFVEYFIIGSLISFVSAIVTGCLVKMLI